MTVINASRNNLRLGDVRLPMLLFLFGRLKRWTAIASALVLGTADERRRRGQ